MVSTPRSKADHEHPLQGTPDSAEYEKVGKDGMGGAKGDQAPADPSAPLEPDEPADERSQGMDSEADENLTEYDTTDSEASGPGAGHIDPTLFVLLAAVSCRIGTQVTNAAGVRVSCACNTTIEECQRHAKKRFGGIAFRYPVGWYPRVAAARGGKTHGQVGKTFLKEGDMEDLRQRDLDEMSQYVAGQADDEDEMPPDDRGGLEGPTPEVRFADAEDPFPPPPPLKDPAIDLEQAFAEATAPGRREAVHVSDASDDGTDDGPSSASEAPTAPRRISQKKKEQSLRNGREHHSKEQEKETDKHPDSTTKKGKS
jgi:hypothetical protein